MAEHHWRRRRERKLWEFRIQKLSRKLKNKRAPSGDLGLFFSEHLRPSCTRKEREPPPPPHPPTHPEQQQQQEWKSESAIVIYWKTFLQNLNSLCLSLSFLLLLFR